MYNDDRKPQPTGVTRLVKSLVQKRQRLLLTVLAIAGTFLLWTNFSSGTFFSLSGNNSVGPVTELDSLMYRLSTWEKIPLPEETDTSEPLTPDAWVPESIRLDPIAYRQKVQEWKERNPIVVFSKTYCPFSRKAKNLIASYHLKKSPLIIEVDTREDGPVIKALLGRLTRHATFPNVIIAGKSHGGSDNLQALHEKGTLTKLFKSVRAI